MHGGMLFGKNKPLADLHILQDLQWYKVFLIDGPKARHSHQLASHSTFAYMLGGKSGEKFLRDLWKFDFENVQP